MSKGYFLNTDGHPVYYGTRADKPALETDHTWLASGDAPTLPDADYELYRFVGNAWVPRPEAVAARDARAAAQALAKLDRDDGSEFAEAMWGVLVAKGVVVDGDLPADVLAKLDDRRARRSSP